MSTPVVIENNTDGTKASVTVDNQLTVQSETLSLQHYISFYDENVYQVIGTTTPNGTAATILHLKNNDSENTLVVSYMRLGIVDAANGTAFPSANSYFTLGFDTAYSSGGTTATPVNMNAQSGKTANVVAYGGAPVVSGTFAEFDRRHIKADGDEYTYNKEGSLLLGLGNTLDIRLQSDHTAGTAIARVTFIMVPNKRR